MKNKLFLLLTIAISKFAVAQNPYLDYKYAFKISNLSTFQLRQAIPNYNSLRYGQAVLNYDILRNQLELFHPTLAFDWMSKRKNTHEIEWTDLFLNRTNMKKFIYTNDTVRREFIDKTIETAISFRYEYMINFCTKKESKWVPSLGFSFNPYYQRTKSFITDDITYQTGIQTLGIRAAINPRITYFFSKNLFINAGFSFTMLDVSRISFTNPASAVHTGAIDQHVDYNFKGLKDLFEFRVGLGYKF